MQNQIRIWICISFLWWSGPVLASADLIRLRTGEEVQCKILRVANDAYLIQPMTTSGESVGYKKLSRHEVSYIILDSPQPQGFRGNAIREEVDILPSESFGEAIYDAVAAAKESVLIVAYFISGSGMDEIASFYDLLRQKAERGVKVTIVCEAGSGTSDHVKNKTIEFAEQLKRSGIEVYMHKSYRVLHKKIIMIDRSVVFMGSANLTGAGIAGNSEINVKVTSSQLANCIYKEIKQIIDNQKKKQ